MQPDKNANPIDFGEPLSAPKARQDQGEVQGKGFGDVELEKLIGKPQ